MKINDASAAQKDKPSRTYVRVQMHWEWIHIFQFAELDQGTMARDIPYMATTFSV